jgi:hypothetical protein
MKTEAWYSGNAYDGKAQSGLTLRAKHLLRGSVA